MQPIQQRLNGHLFHRKGQIILLLADDGPELFLRFAYVRRGVETNIFPSFLLDDWGSEVRKLALYRWIDEFGEQFPRAEVFGLASDGKELQLFLRDLEIHMRLPVFAFKDKGAPLDEGVVVNSFVQLKIGADFVKVKRPAQLKAPLKRSALTWWSGDEASILGAGYERWAWPQPD